MTDELQPTMALLVHTAGNMQGDSSGARQLVLTMHDIVRGTNGPMLNAGRILSHADAQELGSRLLTPGTARRAGIQLVPEVLLRETNTGLTWFRPAQRTHQHWRTEGGREVIDAVIPGLVFHVENGVLHVAAYAGAERPALNTPLYHAPIGNVHDDTLVCTGNATLPRQQDQESIRSWERVLLATNFSHINHPRTLAAKDTSTEQLIAFWKKRKRYTTPPDARFLHPLRKTLSAWLTTLTGEDE
ncbi:PRTRC system protein B [Rhodanobacter sp. B2A1Ga4]|uniref:PRTRC system protein B n=1 Tax=Rhodanobacter sp. B2A1Ga4 TaxID=2778647 RepID=UPI001B382915|nr:PRTRC system protein B [Rhodanobacter sp. B2A1Ga4]